MKSDNTFLVATLTFLTLGMVVLLAFNWQHVPDQWQLYICKPEDCTLQQWLSSLAGWFGGFLAAMGALVVYWQLREQRRQTEFLIGDGDPSMDMVSVATDELSGCFRVVNWNRRLIVLSAVRFTPNPSVQPNFLHSLPAEFDGRTDNPPTVFNQSLRIKPDGDILIKPALAGWEDRSKPPEAAVFVLGYPKDIRPEMFGTNAKAMITVSFEYFAPGDHGLSGTISVRTIRGNLFPRTQAMHDDFVEQEQ